MVFEDKKMNRKQKRIDKPVLVGGFGEKTFGKQFRQGNRVYDAEHLAMCLLSQPIGNTGGYSYLYLIKNK